MQSVFKIFQTLQSQSTSKNDCYNIASLPSVKFHKLGISPSGEPMFFIKCDDIGKTKSLDSNLEFISVQFNRECQLLSGKRKAEEGIYTVISLKSDSIDLQEYFIEVVFLIVRRLSAKPRLKELKVEVERLINLFSKFSSPATKTIQGIWAELLVIERSRDPDYMVRAWHKRGMDKFDFNDGVDKVEVKSTGNSRRIHSFSMEQLLPNKNSGLVVVSIFAVETGVGKSVFDLMDSIGRKLVDKSLLFRINEVVAETLGRDFERTFEVFFDYQMGVDSLAFYDGLSIPNIDVGLIGAGVMNVRFDSDLTGVVGIGRYRGKSVLHGAMI